MILCTHHLGAVCWLLKNHNSPLPQMLALSHVGAGRAALGYLQLFLHLQRNSLRHNLLVLGANGWPPCLNAGLILWYNLGARASWCNEAAANFQPRATFLFNFYPSVPSLLCPLCPFSWEYSPEQIAGIKLRYLRLCSYGTQTKIPDGMKLLCEKTPLLLDLSWFFKSANTSWPLNHLTNKRQFLGPLILLISHLLLSHFFNLFH